MPIYESRDGSQGGTGDGAHLLDSQGMKAGMERVFYFAYGSNMDEARVRERGMPFTTRAAGSLKDYELRFNKIAKQIPGAGHANVVQAPGSWVEGVLYELSDGKDIERMDPFEGYPVRYDRRLVTIQTDEGGRTAWVYEANAEFLAEVCGRPPTIWRIYWPVKTA